MTLEHRLWSRVTKTDECWTWTGSQRGKGYGQIKLAGRKSTTAHRASWLVHHGNIPDGMCVLHKCDNRLCVRPDHLFLGTKADNNADMVRKGRNSYGVLARYGEAVPNSKLTIGDIPQIRALHKRGFSYPNIAKRFGVGATTIRSVITGNTWASVP